MSGGGNERARRAAEVTGRDFYRHDVIETWPACVVCATPIRRDVTDTTTLPGLFRACGCPDVLWRLLGPGWKKLTRAQVTEKERFLVAEIERVLTDREPCGRGSATCSRPDACRSCYPSERLPAAGGAR